MQNKSKNDSITYAKGEDLAKLALKREYDFIYSKFLSPAEQVTYFTAVRESAPMLTERCFFFGGALEADRRVCVIFPSFIDLSDIPGASVFSPERELAAAKEADMYAPDENFGIVPIRIDGSGFAEFSHRHYMGSILSLGIEREVMGDIAVTGKCSAMVFVNETIAPFICSSLTKIGRDGVKVSPMTVPKDFVVPRSFSRLNIISASDRVDSIVASLTGNSRSDAKELCLSGQVEINYVTVLEADERLSPGDKISVRGFGKYIIDSYDGETRSGRAKISVRKYV